MSRKSKLDGLRSDAPAPSPESESTPSVVWLVYSGHSDPDREFPHEGMRSEYAGPEAGYIDLRPGLCSVDGERWALAQDHPNIAPLIGDAVRLTDEHLAGFTSKAQLRDLAERTTQPEALELILAVEMAKPITAGGRQRRELRLVEKLKNRLGAYSRSRPIDFSDLHTIAAARSHA
jgi:hypothetical protein